MVYYTSEQETSSVTLLLKWGPSPSETICNALVLPHEKFSAIFESGNIDRKVLDVVSAFQFSQIVV